MHNAVPIFDALSGTPRMTDVSVILDRNKPTFIHPPVMTPSNHFPDGPLMGNGDVTIVASGPSDLQSFHIGKSDFWTDGEGYEMTNEEYDNYVVSPITIGHVRLWIRDQAMMTYHQEMDLYRAELHGVFEGQEARIQTRAWCCAVENLFVVEISLPMAKRPVGLHWRTQAKQNDDPEKASLPTESGIESDGIIWSSRHTWDRGRWVCRATIALRILEKTPIKMWSGNHSHANVATELNPGEKITAVVAVSGGLNQSGHREDALQRLRKIRPENVAQLKKDHDDWWKAFWNRGWIDLGGDILERFWYGSLYALACCSRPGKTCPGLFGFPTHDHPRWNGDYHLNYNSQHPFGGVFTCNRSELAESYFDVINDFISEGRRRARKDLNPPMPGVYYPIGLGPWGMVAQDNYMNQKCAAAYAAWPFIEHFRYRRDLELTRQKLYPFCREVADFWEAYLVEENGYYHIRGSASHEHGGNDVNTAFDLPLVRNLFKGMIEMSVALGIDLQKRPIWKRIVDRLAPYPVTIFEGLTVFKEADNCDGFTRSISLYNVMWPGAGDVGLWSDPQLCEIGRNTLRRLNLWNQGNSFSWIFPAAVRVGYPGVYDIFRQLLSTPNGLRQNLTYAQAYGGIETCGSIATINEMLLQSYEGVIHLFPCWPVEQDASFHHLVARGGHLVSACLKKGKVEEVRIESPNGHPFTLESPWSETIIDAPQTGQTRVTDRIIHIDPQPRQVYLFQPGSS